LGALGALGVRADRQGKMFFAGEGDPTRWARWARWVAARETVQAAGPQEVTEKTETNVFFSEGRTQRVGRVGRVGWRRKEAGGKGQVYRS
jgi:hypothetical protein